MIYTAAVPPGDARLHHWWHQRHLVWEFLKRDLQSRYIGSAMGFFWSVINPLILLALYTVVFGMILDVRWQSRFEDAGLAGVALYIFCGLLPWYAFQESLVRSTTCVVDHAHLIRQVRFPAKVLPAYIVLSSIVNQLIGTVVLILGLLVMGDGLSWPVLLLPFAIVLQALICFGLGLFLATLHAYLRDIAPLITIALMVCMWMTPLFYPLKIVEGHPVLLWIIKLNPCAHLIILYQQIFLTAEAPSFVHWAVLFGTAVVAFGIGYKIFTHSHDEFADIL